jgi:hypothetical protein
MLENGEIMKSLVEIKAMCYPTNLKQLQLTFVILLFFCESILTQWNKLYKLCIVSCILFLSVILFLLFIHLFICVYIVWAISPLYPLSVILTECTE